MAQYLLRNSLNPGKVVVCSVTFRQLINKGEEGEAVWLIEVVTSEPHKDGMGDILPEYVHYTEDQNLDVAINEATERIAAQVDWIPLTGDLRPPFVIDYEPKMSVVSIHSNVAVVIEDIFPAAGIDLDSIEVVINNLDVTDEIKLTGDPFQYNITWIPTVRIFDYE